MWFDPSSDWISSWDKSIRAPKALVWNSRVNARADSAGSVASAVETSQNIVPSDDASRPHNLCAARVTRIEKAVPRWKRGDRRSQSAACVDAGSESATTATDNEMPSERNT